ncbi:AHH domain-containing protein [uncultured Legionella sp.]|uniref:AHH domain-containing protein n=1 Tax=uncultured Legionella sp. TaxID=210934 RepID=UPI002601B4A8|nr:AHH domain-containing protein [uncultured Legionella sp.]
MSTSALKREQCNNLNHIKSQIGSLTFSEYSPEVNEEHTRMYDALSKANPHASSSRITDAIPTRATIAKKLSDSKCTEIRRQLTELFPSCSSDSIRSFMQGDMNPLANELVSNTKKNLQQKIHTHYLNRSIHDIALAIDDDGDAAAMRIANEEACEQLRQIKELKDKSESGFAKINLGKEDKEVDLKGECFWVPASVRHDVSKDNTAGTSRHSFFVYGGVNIQSRINIIPGGNSSLSGNRVGAGNFNRREITRGFQSHHIVSHTNKATKNHELLEKAGFNNRKDINSKVNRIFLPDGKKSHHENRSLHSGKHTQMAMDAVAAKMDQILIQGKAQGWSQTQYREQLRNMIVNERQNLRNGITDLYVKPRPWAK